MDSNVTLVANDGTAFVVSDEEAALSATISSLLNLNATFKQDPADDAPDAPETCQSDTRRIEFREIDATMLELVVGYMKYKVQYDAATRAGEPVPPDYPIPDEHMVDLLMVADFLEL